MGTKVYTYYEEIEGKTRTDKDREIQQDLLNLWKSSWSEQGFEPVVLGLEHAQSHPDYTRYRQSVIDGHKHAFDINLEEHPYWIVAHNEWIAFASCVPERAVVCDYDVINTGMTLDDYNQLPDGFNWLDGLCSCIAVGTGQEFDKFCQLIIDKEPYLVHQMKKYGEQWNRTEFGDQDYLVFLQKTLTSKKICTIVPQALVHLYEHVTGSHKDKKLVHFAHDTIYRAKAADATLKSVPVEELRLKFVRDLIS